MKCEYEKARHALSEWKEAITQNIYQIDSDFRHSVGLYLSKKCPDIDRELTAFADKVVHELEPLVIENNRPDNLPRIDHYNSEGQLIEQIVHHPSYEAAGNIIYGSRLLQRMATPGGLLEALTFMFLSSQAGEAGHNCPVACSAGLIRVLQKVENFPLRDLYLTKLLEPSYTHNFTAAQFLTEIQGGSDVGQNAMEAHLDEKGQWRVTGEKWFCSNADAELSLVTARFDPTILGTKGLGLFLVPAELESGERNHYTLRRLKDKIGTQSMATAEIDFNEAYAIAIGAPQEGFKLVMENVLHTSRLFNTFCVLGMARRAYQIALAYAQHRQAFGQYIINYPLVKEHLAQIKAENSALLASIFATTKLQDDYDEGKIKGDEIKLLLRLLTNLNKYLSALWSVEHIHHALDILAGNGAIENFSTIPRLLRDCIVCENWEGTHNTLRMQILKDILRYRIDDLYLHHLQTTLTSLKFPEDHLNSIKRGIERLKDELSRLKSASPEIQNLKIKTVVDQMAILFSAVQLTFEAVEQSKLGELSKQHCVDYFLFLHLNRERNDLTYLELINRIN